MRVVILRQFTDRSLNLARRSGARFSENGFATSLTVATQVQGALNTDFQFLRDRIA
jgi:hypothetical protein